MDEAAATRPWTVRRRGIREGPEAVNEPADASGAAHSIKAAIAASRACILLTG